MANYDLRLDVPALAFINAQLFVRLQKGGTLSDAKKHLFSSEPYSSQFTEDTAAKYPVINYSLMISLLYCLVVVPREILNLPQNHQIYRDFDDAQITRYFAVISPAMDSYTFIRCLRNSVAHGLFTINETKGVCCYEFRTERAPILERAIIWHDHLSDFLNVVGKVLVNTVLELKRTRPNGGGSTNSE